MSKDTEVESMDQYGSLEERKKEEIYTPVMSFRIKLLSDDSSFKFFSNEPWLWKIKSQKSHASIMYWLGNLGQIIEPL